MTVVSTDGTSSYRYERKYAIAGMPAQTLALFLRNCAYGFREIYAARVVNNVYYDTPYFRFYNENLHGVADRQKVRVRWYGDTCPEPGCARLEFKRKNGLVGTKRIFDLEGEVDFSRPGALPVPEEYRCGLTDVRPMLFNRYTRRYFLSFDGRFRATIDYDLQYTNPRFFRDVTRLGDHDPETILELKYDRESDDLTGEVTADWKFRYTKKSKYVSGISKVYGV